MVETQFITNTDGGPDSIEGSLVCILWLLRHPEAMRAERKSRIPEYCSPPFVFRTETGQNDQNPNRQKHCPIVARTSEWSIHGNEAIGIREAKKFVAVQSVLAAELSEIVDLVAMVAVSMRTTGWDEGTVCERHDAAMDVARPDAASLCNRTHWASPQSEAVGGAVRCPCCAPANMPPEPSAPSLRL